MLNDALMLLGGLAALMGGGYALVRGASGLAASFGVSEVVIGLTVVAFGTSAPELAVNALAASRGVGAITFGNVIGSNIANLGLILGLSAAFAPLTIEGRIVVREIPMMLLATACVAVLGTDPDFAGDRPGAYPRAEGCVLLLVFGVFLYNAVGDVARQRRADAGVRQAQEIGNVPPPRRMRQVNAALVLVGLVGLYIGGELTVNGGTAIARGLGLSNAVIGLTVVAVGTSLPELVTSIMAAARGQADIAVGNVVGSNIFNLLFVLGISATVAPVPVPEGGLLDLAVLTVLSAVLLPFAITHQRRIMRWEGIALMAAWFGYTTFRIMA